MKTKIILPTLLALICFGLLMSSFRIVGDNPELEGFAFQRTFPLKGKSQEQCIAQFKDWMIDKYGSLNVEIHPQRMVAQSSFYVIERSFFGKNTKVCHYTYSLSFKDDSVQAKVEEVFFTWYKASMSKGDRGGTQFKGLEDILPLEKKVPLEKRAYRQYLSQMREHLDKVFEQTEKLTNDSCSKDKANDVAAFVRL